MSVDLDDMSAQMPSACYANYFEVAFNADEFLFRFGQHYPEMIVQHVHTTVVTSAPSAHIFFDMFRDALTRYDEQAANARP